MSGRISYEAYKNRMNLMTVGNAEWEERKEERKREEENVGKKTYSSASARCWGGCFEMSG